jgi:putative glutamine amidotransferase
MTAPRIAVPTYHLAAEQVPRWAAQDGFGVPGPYVDALRRSGARPVLVPPGPEDAKEVLDGIEGLLLVGGGDVDPARYGGDPAAPTYGVEPDRDRLEIDLVVAAAERGVPTLAICRGAQVANVALGGTLMQHLPDLPGVVAHGSPMDHGPVAHDVRLEPGSAVAAATGADRLSCTSHHHQGIDRVGEGLRPTGWADDGQIEALEGAGGLMVAVVWHPEITAPTDPGQQGLFDALARRASVR